MFYRCLQKRVSAQKLSRETKPKRYARRSSVLIIPTAPSRHLHLNKQHCSLSGFLLQRSVVRMEALLWVAVQTRVPSTWTPPSSMHGPQGHCRRECRGLSCRFYGEAGKWFVSLHPPVFVLSGRLHRVLFSTIYLPFQSILCPPLLCSVSWEAGP